MCVVNRDLQTPYPFINCHTFSDQTLLVCDVGQLYGRPSKLFRACALPQPNLGALPTVWWLLVSLELLSSTCSPCAWNYYPYHLSSCGNTLRLSCSLAQALTSFENAADLNDALLGLLFDYILLWTFTFSLTCGFRCVHFIPSKNLISLILS